MDGFDENTPASPPADFLDSWSHNAGAVTPEHVHSDHEDGLAEENGAPQSPPMAASPVEAASPADRRHSHEGDEQPAQNGSPGAVASPRDARDSDNNNRDDDAARKSRSTSPAPHRQHQKKKKTIVDSDDDEDEDASGAPKSPAAAASDDGEIASDDDDEAPVRRRSTPADATHARKRRVIEDDDSDAEDSDAEREHGDAVASAAKGARAKSADDDDAEDAASGDDSDAPAPKRARKNRGGVAVVASDAESDDADARSAASAGAESGDEGGGRKRKRDKKKRARESSDESSGGESSDDSDAEKEKGEAAPEPKEKDADEILDEIFGEEGEEEPKSKRKQDFDLSSDEGDARLLRGGDYSDDEGRPSYKWDFDEIMARKKEERKRKRGAGGGKRRGKDGGIDLINDADDQIRALVEQMNRAAHQDRTSNENRQPAFQKHKLLPVVRQTLLRQDFFEALLDNGMMSAVSEWLAPLPDKSLPSLEVRTTLLKILSDYPVLEQGILRQSGLGKAVMYLLKHPRETKENKQRAARLIRDWSRPIFQLDTDYKAMTREERMEIDHTQNRRRQSQADESQEARSSGLQRQPSTEEISNPAHAGFIQRARVPKPSMKAYVNRPKPSVEGQFHGPSKNKSATRFDLAQRGFKERTKTQKARRHVSVSISGGKMSI